MDKFVSQKQKTECAFKYSDFNSVTTGIPQGSGHSLSYT